jgi:hypothetical protein
MAEMKAELVKWVVGIGFAQVATILAVPKALPFNASASGVVNAP